MQYLKAENAILNNKFKQVDFKIRQPKSEGIYYFRINKQYRAIWRLEDNIFYVTSISDHSK